MQELACGLPSMIQEGSIGDGFNFAVIAAVSIDERDTKNLDTRSDPSGPQNSLPALLGKQGSLLSLIPTIKVKRKRPKSPQVDAGPVLLGAYAVPTP
jgi:hypothetical protein